MPSATIARPDAAVVEVAAEQQVHGPRPEHEQAERDGAARTPAIARHGDADRAVELRRGPRSPSGRRGGGAASVWIAWKSCSGARAMSRTLKTKPASAASLGRRIGEQHRRVEDRLLGEHDGEHREREAAARAQRRALGRVDAGPAARVRRRSAHGTTTSDTNGAATMPSATADCPRAIPIATASGNMKRDSDSKRTSSP